MSALPFSAIATRAFQRTDPALAVDAGSAAVVRRWAEYRRSARAVSMSVPAEQLGQPAVATWVRRAGVSVHTRSAQELDLALASGVTPARITLLCNEDATLARRGIHAGVGRFVIRSPEHCDSLRIYAPGVRRVIIDSTAASTVITRAARSNRLEILGMHHRLPPLCENFLGAETTAAITSMIADLSQLRRQSGHIATRLSFAGAALDHSVAPTQLRAIAEHLESTVEDSCAHFRYPRPALVIQLT